MKKKKGKIERDMVNHPKHYGGDTVYEVLKVLEAWMTFDQFIGMCRGQAMIYLARADKKGETQTDLKKAAFYINYEIDYRRRAEVGLTGNGRAKLKEVIEGVSIEELIQKAFKEGNDEPFIDLEEDIKASIPKDYAWDEDEDLFKHKWGGVAPPSFQSKWHHRRDEFPKFNKVDTQ